MNQSIIIWGVSFLIAAIIISLLYYISFSQIRQDEKKEKKLLESYIKNIFYSSEYYSHSDKNKLTVETFIEDFLNKNDSTNLAYGKNYRDLAAIKTNYSEHFENKDVFTKPDTPIKNNFLISETAGNIVTSYKKDFTLKLKDFNSNFIIKSLEDLTNPIGTTVQLGFAIKRICEESELSKVSLTTFNNNEEYRELISKTNLSDIFPNEVTIEDMVVQILEAQNTLIETSESIKTAEKSLSSDYFSGSAISNLARYKDLISDKGVFFNDRKFIASMIYILFLNQNKKISYGIIEDIIYNHTSN